MTEMTDQEMDGDWLQRWRLARTTAVTASAWVLTLPFLARLLRWRQDKLAWVHNVLGAASGLVWGRIGWVGVRRYGFSNEDAFLAGGLAGVVTPTFTLLLRRLGWSEHPADSPAERGAQVIGWLWGFLAGGLVAAAGAMIARIGRARID